MSEKAEALSNKKKPVEKKKRSTSPKKVKFEPGLTPEKVQESEHEESMLKESEQMEEELEADLRIIGEVGLEEEDHLLSLDNFCRVYMLIKKHVEPRLKHRLDSMKRERRRKLA